MGLTPARPAWSRQCLGAAWHGMAFPSFFHRPRLGLCSALLVKFANNSGQGVTTAVGPVADSSWIRRAGELGRLTGTAEAGYSSSTGVDSLEAPENTRFESRLKPSTAEREMIGIEYRYSCRRKPWLGFTALYGCTRLKSGLPGKIIDTP
jgi:hypothetical protein